MAHEITYNSFEMSLVVFMPNNTTNHAITYTNNNNNNNNNSQGLKAFTEHTPIPKLRLSDPPTPNIGPCTHLSCTCLSCLSGGF